MNELQKNILEIYEEVKKVCDKNSIPFFAIGGTCLGAVRHQGFIPWDDDLDIAIPVELYNQFWDICRAELPPHLKIYSPQHDPHRAFYFGKVMDTRTTFIENMVMDFPDEYGGVYVDIMPIAGVPENSLKRWFFLKKLKTVARLSNFIRRDRNNKYEKTLYRIGHDICDKLGILNLFPVDFFWKMYMNEVSKHPFYESNLTGYTWDPLSCHRIIVSAVDFSKTIELPFETAFMKCPIGYEDFLTTMFGDYMQLPPESQRTAGHSGFVDLERPYSYYQEQFRKGEKMPWSDQ